MSNIFADYKRYARENLPEGMTFENGLYIYHRRRFGNYADAIRYYNYLHKSVFNPSKILGVFHWAGNYTPGNFTPKRLTLGGNSFWANIKDMY